MRIAYEVARDCAIRHACGSPVDLLNSDTFQFMNGVEVDVMYTATARVCYVSDGRVMQIFVECFKEGEKKEPIKTNEMYLTFVVIDDDSERLADVQPVTEEETKLYLNTKKQLQINCENYPSS